MNYYISVENCKNREIKNTNSRYKNFCQTHFTAGDYQQFCSSRDYQPLNDNFVESNIDLINWNKYKNLSDIDIENTFRYIFEKFKKGIFIKIRNNKVETFLPFSNSNYINEFPKIHYTKQFPNLDTLSKYVTEKSGYIYNSKYINKFDKQWYANNSLVRNEFPIKEGDSGAHQMMDMFEQLCKNRKVPDIEFFVNRRDFPILKKNSTEPYECIFGKDKPLLSHDYDKYCPILSMNGNEEYADIIIPTWDDWSRVRNIDDNVFFPKPLRNYKFDFSTPWKDRKEIAVFRGSSTGISCDLDENRRLKLCKMKHHLLDVGITKLNLRPRFYNKDEKLYLSTVDVDKLQIDLAEGLSPEQQSKYKYVINIEGHSIAYRLSLELSMGCVILLVDCHNKLWYSDLLQEYRHYVPVKNDLSDLIEKITWCRENDDKCQEIAKNAKRFYDEYLGKEGMFDYLETKLNEIKQVTGTYKYFNHDSIEENILKERKLVKNIVSFDIEFFEKFKSINSNIFISQDEKIIKKTSNSNDIIHSAYIGLNYINKLNLENFSKTYGINDNSIYIENIKGTPFNQWIRKNFQLRQYFSIMKKMLVALEKAQEKCNFIHYDLYPWNIIIKNHNNTPVIIDYGRSMVKNKDHLVLEMVKPHKFHDVLTIMLSSLHDILKYQKLSKVETKSILNYANLISKSRYTKFQVFKNLKQLKEFLHIQKRFDRMLYSDKYELTRLTPKYIYDKI